MQQQLLLQLLQLLQRSLLQAQAQAQALQPASVRTLWQLPTLGSLLKLQRQRPQPLPPLPLLQLQLQLCSCRWRRRG